MRITRKQLRKVIKEAMDVSGALPQQRELFWDDTGTPREVLDAAIRALETTSRYYGGSELASILDDAQELRDTGTDDEIETWVWGSGADSLPVRFNAAIESRRRPRRSSPARRRATTDDPVQMELDFTPSRDVLDTAIGAMYKGAERARRVRGSAGREVLAGVNDIIARAEGLRDSDADDVEIREFLNSVYDEFWDLLDRTM
jgi:hypothetical protein